jgi:type IV secretion system protein VirB6
LVAIAPLAIVASLTPATKSFFEAWLSAVIMMFMYPLVLGGVFATILAMGNATTSSLNANEVNSFGDVLPIMTNTFLSITMVLLSPVILSLITGSMQIGILAGAVGGLLSKGSKGAFGGAVGASKMAAGGAKMAGGAMKGAAANTANFMKPGQFGKNVGEGINHRAAQLNRGSERFNKFRGK